MKHDLKESIIDTATQLFMTRGYNGTSTREISKILNVTQPAIYHHFKTKEQLYVEVLTRHSESTFKTLDQISNDSPSYQKKLLEMSAFLHEQPMNLSLIMHDIEFSLSDEAKITVFKIWSDYYLSPFITYFESIEENITMNLSSKELAHHFLRVLSSYISVSEYNQVENEKLEQIVIIFLNGITK